MGACRRETWEQNPFSSCRGVSFPELSTPQQARPPTPPREVTLFPYTTLFRSEPMSCEIMTRAEVRRLTN